MDSEQATPSLSQAQRLKKFSQEGHLSLGVMRAIMSEEKKSDLDKVTFSSEALRKYFPKSYTPQRMQEKILQPAGAVVQTAAATARAMTACRAPGHCRGLFDSLDTLNNNDRSE